MDIVGVAYFTWTPLINKVRQIQPRGEKKIPLLMKDFEPSDFDKVEKFVCDNTKFIFS